MTHSPPAASSSAPSTSVRHGSCRGRGPRGEAFLVHLLVLVFVVAAACLGALVALELAAPKLHALLGGLGG